MYFEDLTIKGFMAIGDAHVPLHKQGLVLIEGVNEDDESSQSNGAGKSSIFEALLWALYGYTLKYGDEQDRVVKIGEKGAEVSIVFYDDTGKGWTVTRTRNPNRLEVWRGSSNVTASTMKETQALLNDTIGLDRQTFVNTVLFGQENVVPFSKLTDKEQKAVLERLVGIEAITEAHKKMKEKLRLAQTDEQMAIQKCNMANEAVERAQERVEEYEQKEKEWVSDQKQRLNAAKSKLLKLGKLNAQAIADKVLKAKQVVLDAETNLDLAQDVLTIAEKKLTTASMILANAVTDVRKAKMEVDRIVNLKGTCKTCGEPINPSHKLTHLTNADKALKNAQREENDAQADVDATAQHRDKAKAAVQDCKNTLRMAQDEVSAQEELLAEAKQQAITRTAIKDEIQRISAETNVYEAEIVQWRKTLAAEQKKLKAADAKHAEAEKEREHVEFLCEALSNKGLKSFVLDSVVPFLNSKATEYASLLSAGNMSVEFRTQSQLKSGEWRENFEVLATNKHGAEVYAGNSGGEKRKIDVAVALALQALAASRAKSQIGLALYDEPMENLDATACECFLDLLVEEARKRDTVLVITHREEVKASFPRVWVARKENGTTEVEIQ